MKIKKSSSDNIATVIPGTVETETAKAYLFDNGTYKVWLPKSMCTWDDYGEQMTMPLWLARKEDLMVDKT